MKVSHPSLKLLCLTISTILLSACGGGGGSGSNNGSTVPIRDADNEVVKQTVSPVQNTDIPAKDDVQTTPSSPATGNNDNSNDDADGDIPTEENVEIGSTIEKAVLKQLNDRRTKCGFGSIKTDASLHNAAANHANYLLHMNKHSTQDFQGHKEINKDHYSGLSNPYFTGLRVDDRINTKGKIGNKAVKVNYSYQALGENLSQIRFTDGYITDERDDEFIALNSFNGLLAAPYHMASMLSPYFTQVGISYGRDTLHTSNWLDNQKSSGSVLEMVFATPKNTKLVEPTQVLSYPCDGTVGTQYELKHEAPNPFGKNGRDLYKNPIGQPIYILGNGAIKVTNYHMKNAANEEQPLQALTAENDPHKKLDNHQVILMPLQALEPNQMYRVTYNVSVNGASPESKEISFTTKPKLKLKEE